MEITIKAFDDLSLGELYDILALRQEIFVVEQDCVYQDADYIDQKSYHVMGHLQGQLVAYTRIVPSGLSYEDYGSIGRVVVHKDHRGKNYGQGIMARSNSKAIELIDAPIKISAQVYALSFYERLGYVAIGREYLEDGIPHKAMILQR